VLARCRSRSAIGHHRLYRWSHAATRSLAGVLHMQSATRNEGCLRFDTERAGRIVHLSSPISSGPHRLIMLRRWQRDRPELVARIAFKVRMRGDSDRRRTMQSSSASSAAVYLSERSRCMIRISGHLNFSAESALAPVPAGHVVSLSQRGMRHPGKRWESSRQNEATYERKPLESGLLSS
jgi:hypothetical protein